MLLALNHQPNMPSEFTQLSDRVIRLNERITAITSKVKQLFVYHAADDYPTHLNILGYFLYQKYYMIRAELIKLGAHVKNDAQYLVPLNGLKGKYESLKVYLDQLAQVPNINQHLKEVSDMLEYASDPQPIT